MLELFDTKAYRRPGFRLQKLEVYNWGTFDSTQGANLGRVYTIRPQGETALLIGQNGSGKSTLVDALLTLLVRPAVRNYNVAAGAGKRERDERTYIKGAFGRLGREEDNRADVQFLRPDGGHYSVALASFRNEASGRAFTIAQILYLDADSQAKKVYCFAGDERSIEADCSGLVSMDKLKRQMQDRGFRVTTTYNEFHEWFRKATGIQPKAMDMFNQTVAVKDIHRLNDFIRQHMLETKPWHEKVDKLLHHFTELSQAHQSLVRVRQQFELLQPIAALGEKHRRQALELEHTERLLAATATFFRQKTLDLFTPALEAWQRELAVVRERKVRLSIELEAVRDSKRRLQNEIEQAGGARLREIPLLIKHEQASVQHKRGEHCRFQEALQAAGIDERVRDAGAFAAVQRRLPGLLAEIDERLTDAEARQNELVIERAEVVRTQREDETELAALRQRQGNLPESLVELRRRLCEELRLTDKELPFVAELVAVNPDQRRWEASIEMVLRGFALSLLVPPRHYALVSRYVDRTRLADGRGRGQRLVYLKVESRGEASQVAAPHQQSLLRKLDFRPGHPLVPWVRQELAERFDYRCCDQLEAFQAAPALAMTAERHIKFRGVRHEKDDRDRAGDPRHFVLGWDNREKRRHLAERIEHLRLDQARLDKQVDQLHARLAALRDQQTGLRQARQVGDFNAIDYQTHEREIVKLQREKKMLEEKSDVVRALKRRLAEEAEREKALESDQHAAIIGEAQLDGRVADAQRLLAAAQRELDRQRAEGAFAGHAAQFSDLEARLEEEPLAVESLLSRESELKDALRTERDRQQRDLQPLRDSLTTAMGRFLARFPNERADLEPSLQYLDSFLGLLDRIREEDLPQHEQRFKERLNEKVTHEIGLLNGALQTDRSEIEDRIELLNQSLRQVEYRPGTHMRLEARPVRDPEIVDFRRALAECLADSFEGTPEADEARYLRIERLITRLREEDRWREKVTDVRRWFDFAARELDDATGQERGYYEDSAGQSGGEKAKLAFTILVAAIAYQYGIDPTRPESDRFHFVVVDEMFSKIDDRYSEYALELFEKFGLQLLIVAPLDAKARVTEPYVGSYLHVVKDAETSCSEILSMTAREFEEQVAVGAAEPLREWRTGSDAGRVVRPR